MAMILAILSLDANAETLASYAQQCASELGFNPGDMPALNCNDGVRFRFGGPVNDYVGRKSFNANVLNSSIDVVFACRWMDQNTPATTAVSVEMLIHNRTSGSTCFFAAKDNGNHDAFQFASVSTAIVSPFDATASTYWMQPADLNSKSFTHIFDPAPPHEDLTPNPRLQCVGCHVAGPYIASFFVAPALAQFGLLNDDHDTLADPSVTRYHAVGSNRSSSAFWGWDSLVTRNNVSSNSTCASGCHSIGSNSTVSNIADPTTSDTVIPSITEDITDIIRAGVMPADASSTSVYRWVNMSEPASLGDGGESETLSDLQRQYPRFYCSNPTLVQAHVAGSNLVFNNHQLDRLHSFNLNDGLVCLNADQPNGEQCDDYQTRYQCDGTWTEWRNMDRPTASGDWEPRHSFPGLCASPTAIQARHDVSITSTPVWAVINGPNDRLAEFDSNGLVCNNFEQPGGRCSNYVVRFICP